MKLPKPKTKKAKIAFFSALAIIFVASLALVVVLFLLARIDYILVDDPTFEVKSENTIAALFTEVRSGAIEDPDSILDTVETGEKSQSVTLVSQLGTKQTIDITYHVTDTVAPVITGDDELSFETTADIDILSHFTAEDNSDQAAELSIEGDYDLKKAGDYTVTIIAKDASGNQSSKEITLKITEPPRPVAKSTNSGTPYYIEVNRQQNVVIVYAKDQNGDYSKIAKVFVASTGAPGSETPLGTFTVSDRYETLYLVGNVWGHYTLRINGPIFFHSVPYFSKGPDWDDLEYLEYNKLGSGASAGCVRLAAIDAKWIYDNIQSGTTVKIYDSNTLPAGVVKPTAIKIDENDARRGWDPTDPAPNNAWR